MEQRSMRTAVDFEDAPTRPTLSVDVASNPGRRSQPRDRALMVPDQPFAHWLGNEEAAPGQGEKKGSKTRVKQNPPRDATHVEPPSTYVFRKAKPRITAPTRYSQLG